MIEGWRGEALNTAPDSANEIHGDDIAQRFGFKGGLVPGVTISAYLIQPAVSTWGMSFLERGHAHVKVGSPLYDGEQFEVVIDDQTKERYSAHLLRPDGTVSATTETRLNDLESKAPERRGDPVAARNHVGPTASFKTWAKLKQDGCLAFRYHWGEKHGMQTYLRDSNAMPSILLGDRAYANMSYILGMSNWVLAGNAYMNPWVHLETQSQNFQAIPMNAQIVAEMTIADFYEKKGHEFVDADIALYNDEDDRCYSTIKLRAIYKLRGM